jgi:Flp pilus assembly protein TadD
VNPGYGRIRQGNKSQATLGTERDGQRPLAIGHFEAALALAQEMGLRGETWPILSELGRLYAVRGDEAQAQGAYRKAGTIIHRSAETIEDEGLREGFVTAVSVRSALEASKAN